MLLFLKSVINFVKKAFLVVCVFSVVISVFLYFINKDRPKIKSDPIQANRIQIYKNINDPKLNSTSQGKLLIYIYRTTICSIIGEGCTNNPADGDKNFNSSLLGFTTNLITVPYANPPASFSYWAINGLANAGFVPKSYAAEGIGFASIKPFMEVWKVFRNIAYMIIVLVMIAIGFMIMFRVKINQQTVIAVENSLPKIVISLLLVTFSFAIAGFLIDLMYILILVSISLLSGLNIGDLQPGNVRNLQNYYIGAGAGGIFPKSIDYLLAGSEILKMLPFFLQFILRTIVSYIVSLLLTRLIFAGFKETLGSFSNSGGTAGILGNLVGINMGEIANIPGVWVIFLVTALIMPFMAPLIVGLVLAITVFFLFFRIFFMLINSYIKILLLVMFSPLFLLAEALPGKKAFGFWFKGLFTELLTFPVVVLINLTGYIIMKVSESASLGGVFQPPLLGGLDPGAFSMLVGVGLVLLTPDLVKAMKQMLGAKDLPLAITPSMFFGGATSVFGGAMGTLGTFSSINLGLSAFGPQGIFKKGKGNTPKGPEDTAEAGQSPTPPNVTTGPTSHN